MTDDDLPAAEHWFIPPDDVRMDPRQFGTVRPESMSLARAVLFDAVAAGTTAAFNRMGQDTSRDLTEAALRALTRPVLGGLCCPSWSWSRPRP